MTHQLGMNWWVPHKLERRTNVSEDVGPEGVNCDKSVRDGLVGPT